ncbi:MAG: hypothetical protein LUD15_06610 [Bacteroides sp.]|nr:hypothetical protein [Bacteroides sp.]
MNALGIKYPIPGLRILLLNNGGGGIFHLLPGLNRSEVMPGFVAASHRLSAKGWAESAGYRYLEATTEAEFHTHFSSFISPETGTPLLLEVKTEAERDSDVFKEYYHHIKS